MKKLVLAVVILLFANVANADCWLGGVRYPTGSVVNGLVCQPDGSWG